MFRGDYQKNIETPNTEIQAPATSANVTFLWKIKRSGKIKITGIRAKIVEVTAADVNCRAIRLNETPINGPTTAPSDKKPKCLRSENEANRLFQSPLKVTKSKKQTIAQMFLAWVLASDI